MSKVLCFDIGGTFIKYGLVENGELKNTGKFATARDNGEQVLQDMEAVAASYPQGFLDGISISSPGFADNKSGEIVSGNVIEGFNGLNIRDYFKARTGLPVALENDANCATLAEYGLGNGQGVDNMALMTLGTGVGGGLVLNGKLYGGNRNMAGEFGFLFIHGIHTDRPEDEILSGYASTRALTENVSKVLGREVDGIEVFRLAEEGNEQVLACLDTFLDSLAMGIYNVAYTVAPQKILIGGGVSEQPMILDEVKKRVSALTPSFSVDLNDILDIDRAKFGNEAGMMGAYVNFLETFENN